MDQFIIELSKYIFACIALLFLFESYTIYKNNDKKRNSGKDMRQKAYLFLFHFVGYAILYLHTLDIIYVTFYLFQVVTFALFIALFQSIYPKLNRLMLNSMCFLLVIGFIILARLDFEKARKQYFIVLASFVMALFIPYLFRKIKFWNKLYLLYGILGLLLLSGVYLFGAVTNGSKISIGFGIISFQPQELVKILYVFFLAGAFYKESGFKQIFISGLISAAHIIVLVLSRDLGTALIFSVVYIGVLFIATGKYRFLALGLIAGSIASIFAYQLFSHVRVRVATWIDPFEIIDTGGYQITQSLFAISSGGMFGLGIFQGSPNSIPFVDTDFIFSAIAEEFGFIVGVVLILIYTGIFLVFLRNADRFQNLFFRLIGCGLAITFYFQIFLTIGGGLKLIPLTGVTLPLISYGGSSVLGSFIFFALFQSLWLLEQKEKRYLSLESSQKVLHVSKPEYEAVMGMKEASKKIDLNGEEYSPLYMKTLEDLIIQNNLESTGNHVSVIETEFPNREEFKSNIKKQSKIIVFIRDWFTGNNPYINVTKYLYLFLFGILILYMGYVVVIKGPQILDNGYNTRQKILEERNIRGTIYSANHEVLAETIIDDHGTKIRNYPYGSMFAHVVGFQSKGKSGIEQRFNYYLVRSSSSFLTRVNNDLSYQEDKGDNIYTTLVVDVQQAAYEALGDQKGAVIALNPKTGEVYAMVSKPDYDPEHIDSDWEFLLENETEGPLLNRVTQGLYPPGSTFKIFTALTYLREQKLNVEDYVFDCTGSFEHNGHVISCYRNQQHNMVDFTQSFAKSCNSSFANIGLSVSKIELQNTLEECLFNTSHPLSFISNISKVSGIETMSEDMLLQTVIGQGETLITPIHLAMVTAGIANQGLIMKPYSVVEIRSSENKVIKTYESEPYVTIMSKEESDVLKTMMRAVVEEGTATKIQGSSFQISGKTGSAEYSNNKLSHAWFTGFAPYENPEIVVCVIVEAGGSGGEVAAPIAQKVMEAYFKQIAN